MKRNMRSAFNAMKRIGAPVFERDDVDGFILSAEDNNDAIWADYYMEFGIHQDSEIPGVHPAICAIADKYNVYLEWENPGCLVAYPS